MPVLTGLDLLIHDPHRHLQGRRIGLVSHASGTTANLTSGLDALKAHPDVRLVKLFGAEHGIRGDVPAGDPVEDGVDAPSGLPLVSLYGPRKAPTRTMLEDLDLLIVDFQDIGSRYYTFISTAKAVLEAAHDAGCPVLLLDRPNPLGSAMAGNVLAPNRLSFVGALPIPMQHGLTLGELLTWWSQRTGLTDALTVLPVEGWNRSDDWSHLDRPWIPPSPNSTGLPMARLYPGTCLFEGTNLSEGRGTPFPFELIGAPFIDAYRWASALNGQGLPGVRFRPVTFRPSYSKHAGQVVHGVQIHQTAPAQVSGVLVGFTMLASVFTLWPDAVQYLPFIDLLIGDATLQQALAQGRPAHALEEQYRADRQAFRDEVAAAILY